MSGTSYGTCILHVAPDAARGGPLGLVGDGDLVTLNARERILDLGVDLHALQAPERADFDLLRHVAEEEIRSSTRSWVGVDRLTGIRRSS